MKRNILILLSLISASCFAQSKKDTTPETHIVVLLNGGISIPVGVYAPPPGNMSFSENPNSVIYGYSLTGVHADIAGIYICSDKFGIATRYGIDINGIQSQNNLPGIFGQHSGGPYNTVNQYMVGLYLSVCKQQSVVNAYALGLAGLVTAMIPNVENSFYDFGGPDIYSGTEEPGFGSGLGGYIGIGASFKIIKWLHLDLSCGYLASYITFKKGTTTTTVAFPTGTPPYYQSTTMATYSTMQISLGICQVNAGIHLDF